MTRGAFALALIVLGTLVAPLAAVAVWARNQVLDTNTYVSTVAPLASSTAIQSAVGSRVSNALVSRGVGPRARQEASQAVSAMLASDQFAQLWKEANRLAHEQVVAVLEGEGATRVRDGQVVLDLTAVAQRVYATLHRKDPRTFPAKTLPRGGLSFEIFASQDLTKARRVVHGLDRLALLLPILALVLLALAVLVAWQRRITLSRAGLGLAIGLALLLAGLGVARHAYLNAVDSVVPRDAAADFVDVLLRLLRNWARYGVVAGVLVAVAAGLSGRRVRPRSALRVAVVAGACLAVAVWGVPSLVGVLVIAAVAAAAVVVAQLLPSEQP